MNIDAFNAFNIQGYVNPNTTDGIQSLADVLLDAAPGAVLGASVVLIAFDEKGPAQQPGRPFPYRPFPNCRNI